MKFQIKDGLNKVSIRLSEIGSYFHFKKPLTTVWYDCRGSVGKYLCLLPNDQDYKNQIKSQISGNINHDFTDKPGELKDLLNPLFKTFNDGEYELKYYHSLNNKYFEYTSYKDQTTHQYYWFLKFCEPLNLNDQEAKVNEHEFFVNERKAIGHISESLIEYTTNGFYEGNDKVLIATQPKSEIDEERVKYFEDQILKGERPFAIILNSYFHQLNTNNDKSISDYSLQSDSYVLDGHHKLLAYQNLKITPSLVEITHLPKTREEIEFNIEELIEVLYPWQIEHILKNWNEKEKYILKFLNNPISKIHNFIRNGHYSSFYRNGNKKHEAFYINDKVQGISKGWYENGQLEYCYLYENGQFLEGETWFESGQLKSKSDNRGSCGICYYASGNVRNQSELTEDNKIYFQQGWYENGVKEYDVKSQVVTGVMILRKNYDRNCQLLNFEEFDEKEQKFVKRI
jgi:antitoxin component YwqK of YwqJK toxin-antitoxin module